MCYECVNVWYYTKTPILSPYNSIIIFTLIQFLYNYIYCKHFKRTNNKQEIMYKVVDSLGNILRVFPTYKQAYTYKIAMNRYDWRII